MATTNKKQLHSSVVTQVEKFCVANKVAKTTAAGLIDLLNSLLAPKSGGGTVQNPSYTKDGITYHFCRFHQQYEAEQNMVMTNNKSKGYCKASISVWNKRNSAIKQKEAAIANSIISEDFDTAKSYSLELQDLRAQLNDPTTYDFDNDWNAFRA